MAESPRETMYRDAAQRLPVGRVGETDDLAETYIYLMRDGFSTGQVLVVDGGGYWCEAPRSRRSLERDGLDFDLEAVVQRRHRHHRPAPGARRPPRPRRWR